jgi:uncharacterized membrane protein YqjE
MIRTRVALFGLELNIEVARLLGLVGLVCATVIFSLLAVVIFSLFVIVFFWDTPNRMLAMGLLGGAYALLALLFLTLLWRRVKNGAMPFQATLQELERDAHMFSRLTHRASESNSRDPVANPKDGW